MKKVMKKNISNVVGMTYLGTIFLYSIYLHYTNKLITQNPQIIGAKYEFLILVTTILIVIAYIIYQKIKDNHLLTYNLKQIDEMDGIEFEHLVAKHFEKDGYKVSITQSSCDYGADLILRKGNKKIAVQVKRYTNHKVDNSAIQEVVASLAYWKADEGAVVTNSYFTPNAKALAKANNVTLYDRAYLQKHFNIQ